MKYRYTFRRKLAAGFTLIEVLVAVAVIAAALPPLMTLMIKQADYAGAIRDKTVAHWIAEDRTTELRLEQIFLRRLLQREENTQVEMAGSQWDVSVSIDKAEVWTKYTISVSREEGQPLAILVTYLDDV
jgi:general secretion pathway protein I